MDPQQRLLAVAQRLNVVQLNLLADMAEAMTTPIQATADPASDLAVPAFVTNFSNRLLIHHATSNEPLNKHSFEYALRDAFRAAGRTAERANSATTPEADLIVDGVRFSLKTEGSQDISEKLLVISKLMEAAGIRGFRSSQDYVDWIDARIIPRLRRYDRILILRNFKLPRLRKSSRRISAADSSSSDALASAHTVTHVKYQLLELNPGVLMAMHGLRPESFSASDRYGGSRAPVHSDSGRVDFRVVFDGNDEKITITSLPVSLCQEHATFIIPIIV